MSEGPHATTDNYQDDLTDDDFLSTYDSYEFLQYNTNDTLITAHDGTNDPMTRK